MYISMLEIATYVVIWWWFTAYVTVFDKSFECRGFSTYPATLVAVEGLCGGEAKILEGRDPTKKEYKEKP